LYQLAEAAGAGDGDFVAGSGRAPHGMICLNLALTFWDLGDEIPAAGHLADAEGSRR
jgi:hypothetical protein